jgi:hypothetical protein
MKCRGAIGDKLGVVCFATISWTVVGK